MVIKSSELQKLICCFTKNRGTQYTFDQIETRYVAGHFVIKLSKQSFEPIVDKMLINEILTNLGYKGNYALEKDFNRFHNKVELVFQDPLEVEIDKLFLYEDCW